jgi:hypothetical protein
MFLTATATATATATFYFFKNLKGREVCVTCVTCVTIPDESSDARSDASKGRKSRVTALIRDYVILEHFRAQTDQIRSISAHSARRRDGVAPGVRPSSFALKVSSVRLAEGWSPTRGG